MVVYAGMFSVNALYHFDTLHIPIYHMKNQMFHPSFAKTSQQLQITFSVDEYLALMNKYEQPRMFLSHETEVDTYWRRLPRYTIARCPICGAEYTSIADTHGLFHWFPTPQNHRSVFSHMYQNTGCKHFAATQVFLNLNGFIPTETRYFDNESGDIPVIVREFVSGVNHCLAVIHSLPICRVENQKFVPRYTAYTITYYAQDPYAVCQQRRAMFTPNDHWPTLLISSNERGVDPQVADLPYWVQHKKLYWLDIDLPSLPLRSESIDEFPYSDIQGYGRTWIYRKRPKPRWFWQQRDWRVEGEIRDVRGILLNQ